MNIHLSIPLAKKTQTLLMMIAAALIAPAAAWAQPWTGAAGAGVVDEQSTGIYQADTGSLGYNGSGSTSAIVARYNVTDTTATGNPPWTTLELRYFDDSPNSFVRAQLFRLTAGVVSSIAGCTSTDAAVITTLSCSLLGASVNFNAGYIYTVVVTVSRSSTSVTPLFTWVRLY